MLAMANEDDPGDLEAVFWRHFDEACEDGKFRSPEDARHRLQLKGYKLAAGTIRDWRNHKYPPRKEDDFAALCQLLVGEERTEELLNELRAVRSAKRLPRPSTPVDAQGSTAPEEPALAEESNEHLVAVVSPAPPKPEQEGDAPQLAKPSWMKQHRWHVAAAGALVVVLVAGAVLWVVVSPQKESASANPTTHTQSSRTPPTSARREECPSPTVRVESQGGRASVTYCRERREFLLSDDDADKMSAILVIRVNGDERPAWFHSKGYATRTPDGELERVPPRSISVSLKAGDLADFRVCYGHRTEDLTYSPDTCGDWTRFWPAH